MAGDWPILIPGVGAQGGDLAAAIQAGTSGGTCPAVVNVSRAILYASNDADFAEAAADKARWYAEQMASAVTGGRSKPR